MKRNLKFAAVMILCLAAIAVFGQQPKTLVDPGGTTLTKPDVIYRLPPEASAEWTDVVNSRKALAEKYQKEDAQFQARQVALLLGAGIPRSEWDRPVVTEASGVVALMPKAKPESAKKVNQ